MKLAEALLERKTHKYSEEWRKLDVAIQSTNWLTELRI